MWREPLLSVESLQENVACITLGAPMITPPVVTMAMEETPQFGSTVHSIMLDSDPIPKLCKFLDPRCEEVGSEVLLPCPRKSMEVPINNDTQNVFNYCLFTEFPRTIHLCFNMQLWYHPRQW